MATKLTKAQIMEEVLEQYFNEIGIDEVVYSYGFIDDIKTIWRNRSPDVKLPTNKFILDYFERLNEHNERAEELQYQKHKWDAIKDRIHQNMYIQANLQDYCKISNDEWKHRQEEKQKKREGILTVIYRGSYYYLPQDPVRIIVTSWFKSFMNKHSHELQSWNNTNPYVGVEANTNFKLMNTIYRGLSPWAINKISFEDLLAYDALLLKEKEKHYDEFRAYRLKQKVLEAEKKVKKNKKATVKQSKVIKPLSAMSREEFINNFGTMPDGMNWDAIAL
jgi:hypothetical protein